MTGPLSIKFTQRYADERINTDQFRLATHALGHNDLTPKQAPVIGTGGVRLKMEVVMKFFSKATLLIAGAATLVVATPALADRGYERHHDDTGAIVAGVLAVGAIAAIAASSHHDHDRYYGYNGGYAYQPSYNYGYAYPRYGYGYGRGYEGRGYEGRGYEHRGYYGRGDEGRGYYGRGEEGRSDEDRGYEGRR